MKTTKITVATWQDRLDSRWRFLPVERQRRYTRLLFIAYLCLVTGLLVQYCSQAGQVQPAGMRHIQNKGVVAGERQGQVQSNKNDEYENR